MHPLRALTWIVAFLVAWWFLAFGIGPVFGATALLVILAVVAILRRFRQRRA
jgi:hypothetical protein